jgi:FtsP/CotA-like multicopper oxidase with cupredoxin domain
MLLQPRSLGMSHMVGRTAVTGWRRLFPEATEPVGLHCTRLIEVSVLTRTSAASLLACILCLCSADARDPQTLPGSIHTYYIAADEVVWDCAPHGRNLTGTPLAEEPEGPPTGEKYLKAVYREYTDATFNSLKARPPQWEHLGILGPLIRAEVGDSVRVVFKNNSKSFCSIHVHGLAYAKSSEGAVYSDGTSGADKKDGQVPPGDICIYTWSVPERAGPGPHDPSSILWMYHSHFIEPKEMNTGLLGPIIVSRRGSTKRMDGTPRDVDREFVTAFAIFDETESSYYGANLASKKRCSPNLKVSDPVFRQLNLLYTINGLIEGNLPIMTMKVGERVRWYLLANSNEDDVHAVHWHGQTVVSNGMRTDVVNLGPMAMAVADMLPDNVGTWLFHCHVNEHMRGGMQALFTVIQ